VSWPGGGYGTSSGWQTRVHALHRSFAAHILPPHATGSLASGNPASSGCSRSDSRTLVPPQAGMRTVDAPRTTEAAKPIVASLDKPLVDLRFTKPVQSLAPGPTGSGP
jgi:hypothetical protein